MQNWHEYWKPNREHVAEQEARLAEMEALEEARAEYEAQVYADVAQEMNNLNR